MNKAMMLYIVGLRELRSIGRVHQWCWVDTRDNPSNSGTKLEKNGTLPSEDLQQVISCGCWEPIRPYRWGSMLIDPTEAIRVPLPVPPKVKRAEFAAPDQTPLQVSELNTMSQKRAALLNCSLYNCWETEAQAIVSVTPVSLHCLVTSPVRR